MGSLDHPFNPISFALGSGATCILRSVDVFAAHLRDTLVAASRLSDARAAAIETEAAAEIEAAVEFARTSPDPDPRELERDVYA